MAFVIHSPQNVGMTADKIDFSSLLLATASTAREVTISTVSKSTSGALPVVRSLTGRAFMEQLYREGKLLNLPHPQPLSSKEQAERERLAQVFAGGKSMSEIINEGRGPY